MKSILLNPGPVSLSDGVRRAVTSADLCHREPEYFELQDQVISGLLLRGVGDDLRRTRPIHNICDAPADTLVSIVSQRLK